MKNLMLVLFVMMSMAINTEIKAQTACTPAQKEACKKMGLECTPAQAAACQKAGKGKIAAVNPSATAVKVVNKAPAKSGNCAKTCAKGEVASSSEITPVKLVGLEMLKETPKKAACSKPCKKKE